MFKPLTKEDLLERLQRVASKRFCAFRLLRLYALHRRLNALQRVVDKI